MTKRKSRKEPILGGFQFNKINPYGGTERVSAETSLLHIESILPDPDQPRTLLPSDLYERLFTGQQRPAAVLQDWLMRAKSADAPPARQSAVEKLQQLAATIEHRGLINPITVRQPTAEEPTLPIGVQYVIVTGERRWWAHVLLTTKNLPIGDGEQYPDRIRATVVSNKHIRALQLIENVARDDLSLIEKAQGILALRDELSADAERSVKWGEVEAILGMSRSYRSRVLKVLNLSPEAQEIVSQYNMAEKTIRPISERLIDRPDLQLLTLKQIILWSQTEDNNAISYRRVADFVEAQLSGVVQEKGKVSADDPSWWVAKFQQRISGTLKLFDSLEDAHLSEVANILKTGDQAQRDQLMRLRDQLDRLLADA
jgi:ParB/RepB/Spo0J family partition protein